MARPAKSIKTAVGAHTNANIEKRTAAEAKLSNGSNNLVAPSWLSTKQKKIFNSTVEGLKHADILSDLDVDILAEWAWSLDMKCTLEKAMNKDIDLRYDSKALQALKSYRDSFYRCCNELSLSPQSRAKLANAMVQKDDGTELLKSILAD